MKKLTIAALAALSVGGVFAACTDPTAPAPQPLDAAVYAWQFKGKTATGVVFKGTPEKTISSTCSDSTTPATGAEVIRVPGTLAIAAYTYVCEDECTTFESNLQNPSKQEFYATKPFKSAIYKNVQFITAVNVAHVIGKSASQYELEGTAQFKFEGTDPQETFDLTFAGFGTYDKKNGRVSSVSGNFAGTQTPPRYPGKVAGITESCPPADYWTCDTLVYAGAPSDPSVAYGTWSVKYNSAASKKYAKNSTAYWVK